MKKGITYTREESLWAQLAVKLLLVRCTTRIAEDMATLNWLEENRWR